MSKVLVWLYALHRHTALPPESTPSADVGSGPSRLALLVVSSSLVMLVPSARVAGQARFCNRVARRMSDQARHGVCLC